MSGNKPGGGLPALGGGKGGLVKRSTGGGLPSLAGGPKSKTGLPGGLAARRSEKVGNALSTSQMDVAAVLDFTASTSNLRDNFTSRVRDLVQKDRSGVDITFQPVVFNGHGEAHVGNHGDLEFYNGQPNKSGATYINRGIDAGLSNLDLVNPGIFVVITDDPTTNDPDTGGINIPHETIEKLKKSGTLLLCIIDTSVWGGDFEQIARTYQTTYGELGENLIVIGGADDANAIVDAFIEAKAVATKSGKSAVTASNLPEILSGGKGGKNLQIATGGSSKILQIGHKK